jgi:translation elongation factor EF-1beta
MNGYVLTWIIFWVVLVLAPIGLFLLWLRRHRSEIASLSSRNRAERGSPGSPEGPPGSLGSYPLNSLGPNVGHGPRNYHRSDERIEDEICERLSQNGELHARGLKVDVGRGVVHLKGNVMNRRDRRLSEEIVDSVAGVKDVVNDLQVFDQSKGVASQRKVSLVSVTQI